MKLSTIGKAKKPVKRASTLSLKERRGIVDYKDYVSKVPIKKAPNKFYKQFVVDAQQSSIHLAKHIFAGDYKSASREYTKSIKDLKIFLKTSGVPLKEMNINIIAFKEVIFKNLISSIKKQVNKKAILKHSKLPSSVLSEIKAVESKLITDLFNMGVINNKSKMQNIRFSKTNPIQVMASAHIFDNKPNKLFKEIYNIYNSLKKENYEKTSTKFIKGSSGVKLSKDGGNAMHLITLNTDFKNHNIIVVHELCHAYMKREKHVYGRNEVVVTFLSSLLTKKYFNKVRVYRSSKSFLKNQYYVGFSLFRQYVKKHGLDLKYVNQYLLKNKDVILKNSFQ